MIDSVIIRVSQLLSRSPGGVVRTQEEVLITVYPSRRISPRVIIVQVINTGNTNQAHAPNSPLTS